MLFTGLYVLYCSVCRVWVLAYGCSVSLCLEYTKYSRV
jgi:hypothetical protein